MSKCNVKKKQNKKDIEKFLQRASYWKYVVAKDKYFYGILEGHFDKKDKLLFWSSPLEGSRFEDVSIPISDLDFPDMVEGKEIYKTGRGWLLSLLNMMYADVERDTRVLDLTKGDSSCSQRDFNRQINKAKLNPPNKSKR